MRALFPGKGTGIPTDTRGRAFRNIRPAVRKIMPPVLALMLLVALLSGSIARGQATGQDVNANPDGQQNPAEVMTDQDAVPASTAPGIPLDDKTVDHPVVPVPSTDTRPADPSVPPAGEPGSQNEENGGVPAGPDNSADHLPASSAPPEPSRSPEPQGKAGIALMISGPESARVGESINCLFTVRNTGTATVQGVVVTDGTSGLVEDVGSLVEGGQSSFTGTYTVKADDPDPRVFTAIATGTAQGVTVSAQDSHSVRIVKEEEKHERAWLQIEKGGPACARVGEEITYRFEVKNEGDVPVTGVVVTDQMLNMSESVGDLAPHDSRCFTRTYTVKADDPDPLVNTAIATGQSGQGEVSAEDKHCVLITKPGLDIEKSGPEWACVGDEVTYNFKVVNSGNTCLWNVKVEDPMLGGRIYRNQVMLPRTECSFSKTYTVKQGDPGTVVNKATATGCSLYGPVADSAAHSMAVFHPAIELEKGGPDSATVGDTITYTYKVKNVGDVELTDVEVTDNLLGDVGTLTSLDSNQEETLTARYQVKADGPNPLVNTGTAKGTTPCGSYVTATASHTVSITGGLPQGAIRITKTNDTGNVQEGDLVVFTITVENATQAAIAAPVNLTDTYDPGYLSFTAASTAPDSSNDTGSLSWADVSSGAGLSGGQSLSVTVTFQARRAGSTTNTATVSAVDPAGVLLGGTASADVTITEATVPSVPEPAEAQPASSVRSTPTGGTLPRTGADFSVPLAAAWVLITLGLVLMMLGMVRRRLSLRRIDK